MLCNLHAGPGNGLHNGTWMIVVHLGHYVIEAEIASGVNKGKCVLIKPDTPINIYAWFCLNTAKSKFSLVSPVAD